RHPGLTPRLCQKLQSKFAEPLKTVRRSPGFECAAAQYPCAGFAHLFCDRCDLRFAFDRARSGHDNKLPGSNNHVSNLNVGMSPAKLVRNKFVRFKYRSNGLYAREGAQRFLSDFIFRTDDANNDAHLAAANLSLQAPGTNTCGDIIDLF